MQEVGYDNFRDYGYTYQAKVLSSMLSDRSFLARIIPIFKLDYFDTEAFRWVCRITIDYYTEHKEFPTLEVFKSELLRNTNAEQLLKTEIVTTLRDVYKYMQASDLPYIKSETTNFCRNQELKNAILLSVDDLKDRNFERIKERIDAAYKTGLDYNLGMPIDELVIERYAEDSLERITTGWPVIDNLTRGGLPKGKLGIIMAALGAGKTWMAVHLGAAAAEAGKTVIHYTLEIGEKEIGQRYDSRLTGIASEKLKLHTKTISERLKSLPGKIIIKEFLAGVTLSGIEAHIDQCILAGIKPDVIIIDYDELIDVPPDQTMRYDQQMQILYRNARRRIAVGKNVALWIPAQSTRDGSTEDVVKATHSANSYGKNREVDFLITLSRKDRDKLNNTARISIQKSRLGPDGRTFPAEFRPEIGRISVYEEESTSGKKVSEKMSDDTEVKNYLLQKFNDFNNSTNRVEPDIF